MRARLRVGVEVWRGSGINNFEKRFFFILMVSSLSYLIVLLECAIMSDYKYRVFH